MPSGVGVFVIPSCVVLGADKPSGLYTIPMFSVEGIGFSTGAEFIIPVPIVTGTAEVLYKYSAVQLTVPVISAHGYAGVLGRSGIIRLTVPIISGGYGYRGSGLYVLPTPEIYTITPLHGIGYVVLPSIYYGGLLTSVPISKIYRGIVANLSNKFISTYSAFPFTSLAYFQGKYLGANEQGIFLLQGNKDNDKDILAKLKSGSIDFGLKLTTYLRDAWLTFRSDGHLEFTVFVDEDESVTSVDETELASTMIHEEKMKIGRGLTGRYFTITLINKSGADFDIDKIELLVDAIRRKIR